jgi:hypothetical protein
LFKNKKCSNIKNVQFIKCSNLKNVQILKIFKIVRKKNNEKNEKRNEKTKIKNSKTRKPKKITQKKEKTSYAALTGWPSVAPTRAEPSSAPLTGGA